MEESKLKELLAYAEFYHDAGLSVIPLQARGKQPLIQWQEYQKRTATLEEIHQWFERWKDANIGIVTGRVSNIIVLDIDGEEGWRTIKDNNFEIPITWRVSTGKGAHFYFKHPGGEITNFVRRLPGIDLRGDGGYVVAPPSIHPSGRIYQWDNEIKGEPAEAPEWLIQLLKQREENIRRLEPEAWGREVYEGERNEELTRRAGSLLARGFSEEETLNILLAWNKEYCKPPLAEREVMTIVRSISRKEAERRNQIELNIQKIDDLDNKPIKKELLKYEQEFRERGRRLEPEEKAYIIFDWFVEHGGKFFAAEKKTVWLYYQDEIYQVQDDRPFNALMFELSGLNPKRKEGQLIWESLQSIGYKKGVRISQLGWQYTDYENQTIYIVLQEGKIAKIRENSIEILPNGTDNVFLLGDMLPIDLQLQVDKREAIRKLKETVVDNLTCAVYSRWFLVTWAFTSFLIGFAGETLPLMRNSGKTGAGKTWGARLLSYLILGNDMVGKTTDAASYIRGMRVPILFWDNLETRNMTNEKKDFLLVVATGATKTKRDTKTINTVIDERPQTLVLTTGIEPFYDQEIINRTYEVVFDRRQFFNENFFEVKAKENIKRFRNLILSGIFRIIAEDVLPNITEKQGKWKQWIKSYYPNWEKDRTNDYLATMMTLFEGMLPYIDDLQAPWEKKVDKNIEVIFLQWIAEQIKEHEETSQETSEIVWFFEALYSEWKQFKAMQNAVSFENKPKSFEETYKLKIQEKNGRLMFIASSNDLFTAYNLLCKNLNKHPIYYNTRQLRQRINNEKDLLQAKGWIIPTKEEKIIDGTNYYLWQKIIENENM